MEFRSGEPGSRLVNRLSAMCPCCRDTECDHTQRHAIHPWNGIRGRAGATLSCCAKPPHATPAATALRTQDTITPHLAVAAVDGVGNGLASQAAALLSLAVGRMGGGTGKASSGGNRQSLLTRSGGRRENADAHFARHSGSAKVPVCAYAWGQATTDATVARTMPRVLIMTSSRVSTRQTRTAFNKDADRTGCPAGFIWSSQLSVRRHAAPPGSRSSKNGCDEQKTGAKQQVRHRGQDD
jgi:hypothetical protein